MKIYTRRGDSGMTTTLSGSRCSKSDLLIWLMGSIDELQTAIDRVVAQLKRSPHRARLERIQHILWQLAGELSQQGTGGLVKDPLYAHDTEELERWIDEAGLDLKGFVRFSSLLSADVSEARVRARRFERILSAYARRVDVRPEVSAYANRLGDYFFALAVVLDTKPRAQK